MSLDKIWSGKGIGECGERIQIVEPYRKELRLGNVTPIHRDVIYIRAKVTAADGEVFTATKSDVDGFMRSPNYGRFHEKLPWLQYHEFFIAPMEKNTLVNFIKEKCGKEVQLNQQDVDNWERGIVEEPRKIYSHSSGVLDFGCHINRRSFSKQGLYGILLQMYSKSGKTYRVGKQVKLSWKE